MTIELLIVTKNYRLIRNKLFYFRHEAVIHSMPSLHKNRFYLHNEAVIVVTINFLYR